MSTKRTRGPGNHDRGSRARIIVSDDRSAETRIGRNIRPQPNGCWLYGSQPNRYGTTKIGGVTVTTHRYVYEILVGPIDEGCHLHHTCQTPSCCNPGHLQVLTPKEHAAAHKAIDSRSA